MNIDERFLGGLIGTALGDSLGLPFEFLNKRKGKKRAQGKLKQRLFFGFGFVSDDTDHAIFVSQCLIHAPNDVHAFNKRLGWCLRFWLLSLPPGIGRATLFSCIKLLFGFTPNVSGTKSAGNGPAMRAAMIGAFFYNDTVSRINYMEKASKITHRDEKALAGALAIAHLAAFIVRTQPIKRPNFDIVLDELKPITQNQPSFNIIIEQLTYANNNALDIQAFANYIGCTDGVSGYIYHTVPMAIYLWYHHLDQFDKGIQCAIQLGGDTDTLGAISGALLGLTCGANKLPISLSKRIIDWPRTKKHYQLIAKRLALSVNERKPTRAVFYLWPLMIVRNLFAMVTIIIYAFLRQLP